MDKAVSLQPLQVVTLLQPAGDAHSTLLSAIASVARQGTCKQSPKTPSLQTHKGQELHELFSPFLEKQVDDGIAAILMVEEDKQSPVHEPCSLLKLN